MLGLVLQFGALAAVIVVAGTYLTKSADALGARFGLGRTVVGILMLATATSLPELAVNCSAVLIPAPDLAVGDLLGSCLFNLLILAVLDTMYRSHGRMLSRKTAAHALSAVSGILLTSIALLALLIPIEWPLDRVGWGSIAIGLSYVLCLRLVYFDQRFQAEQTEQLPEEAEARREPESSLVRWPAITYAVSTIAILATGPWLAHTADGLAAETGLGATFVGTLLVGLSTSLPELSTTRAAVRIDAYDLAVGNIFGSNSFNLLTLLPVDLFYSGNLLADVQTTHAVTAVAVILITAVTTMTLLYRVERRILFIEFDAALIILLVLGAFGLVYWVGDITPVQ